MKPQISLKQIQFQDNKRDSMSIEPWAQVADPNIKTVQDSFFKLLLVNELSINTRIFTQISRLKLNVPL